MIDLTALMRYVPSQHGEHGVDALLHLCARSGGDLHEVFSNPPGASWTQFDIRHPRTGDFYRWDHIPRAPVKQVKRPDWVVQCNEGDDVHLLALESKVALGDLETDIAPRLTACFTHPTEGLLNKPAWPYYSIAEPRWQFLPPDAPNSLRYWLRDYDRQRLHLWSGFACALAPEYYADTRDAPLAEVHAALDAALTQQRDLDVIIAIAWTGEFHEPLLLRRYSAPFQATPMATLLDACFASCLQT